MRTYRWRSGLVAAAVAVATVATAGGAQTVRNGIYTYTQEVAPPALVVSPGTGTFSSVLSADQLSLTVNLDFINLLQPATGAHIHIGGPGVNGPIAIDFATPTGMFPVGALAGTYSHTFDLTAAASYGGGYLNTTFGGNVAAARADFVTNFVNNTVYANIHSAARPAGEIRANVGIFAAPEPSTYALMATGLAGVALAGWRRRRA